MGEISAVRKTSFWGRLQASFAAALSHWHGDAVDDIPRYPPFLRGIPCASIDRVVSDQSELIAKIQRNLKVSADEFNSLILPSIHHYARHVHLLPASESQHHCGAGGLFRHGLEVGFNAFMLFNGKRLNLDANPEEADRNSSRWQIGVFLAGMLHDIGKPHTDYTVTSFARDPSQTLVWNPHKATERDLWSWVRANKVTRYHLRWESGRRNRHRQLPPEMFMLPEVIDYLGQVSNNIILAIREASTDSMSRSAFALIIDEADSASVQADLKSTGSSLDTHNYSVPYAKNIMVAIRVLARKLPANTPGALFWRDKDSVYLVWPNLVDLITREITKTKTFGIPADPNLMARALIEKGFAEENVSNDGTTSSTWLIWPEALGGKISLRCLRINEIGRVYEDEPPVPAVVHLEAPSQTQSQSQAQTQTQTQTRETDQQAEAVASPSVPVVQNDPPGDAHSDLSASHIATQSVSQKTTPSKEQPAPTTPPTTDDGDDEPPYVPESEADVAAERARFVLEPSATPATGLPSGQAGDLLNRAIELYRTDPMIFEILPSKLVGIPHPQMSSEIDDPRQVMQTLSAGGILELDPTSPGKTQTIAGRMFLVLNKPTSAAVKAAIGQSPAVVPQPLSPPAVASQPARTTATKRAKGKEKDTEKAIERIADELLAQVAQGYGSYIEGDVTTDTESGRTTYLIPIKSIDKIADAVGISSAIITVRLKNTSRITFTPTHLVFDPEAET